MDNQYNLHAYDEVEKVQLEMSTEKINAYLRDKLQSAVGNVDFIKRHVYKGRKLDVCELGTGNGKLLYALEMDGVLGGGDGFEVSVSRCKLADKFGSMLDSKLVNIANENFLDSSSTKIYDLIICVDVCFQIVAALYDGAEHDALGWMDRHLRPGGCIFIELMDYSDSIRNVLAAGGKQRSWVEFSEGDPFRFGLHLFEVEKNDCFVITKTHIRRDGGIVEGSKIAIRSYNIKDFLKLFEDLGYECRIFPVGVDDGEMEKVKGYRLLAKKRKG